MQDVLGATFQIISAGFFAMISVWTAWMIVPAVAALTESIFHFVNGRELGEIQATADQQAREYSALRNKLTGDYTEKSGKLKAAQAAHEKEQKALNVLMYGSETRTGDVLTLAALKRGLEAVAAESPIMKRHRTEFAGLSNTERDDRHGLPQNACDAFYGHILNESRCRSVQEAVSAAADDLAGSERSAEQHLAAAVLGMQNEVKKTESAYDVAVASSLSGTETGSAVLEDLARKAWGNGAWDSLKYSRSMGGIWQEEYYGTDSGNRNTDVRYSREEETYRSDAAAAALENYRNMLAADMDMRLSVRAAENRLKEENLAAQEKAWSAQTEEVRIAAEHEWAKAESRILSDKTEFERKFARETAAKTETWNSNYAGFLSEKQRWIYRQYAYAENRGAYGTLKQSGADVKEAIGATLSKFEAVSAEESGTAEMRGKIDAYIKGVYDGKLLSAMKKYTAQASERGAYSVMTVRKGERKNTAGFEALSAAMKVQDGIETDMKNAAAALAAQQAEETIRKTMEAYLDRIRSENRGMDDWEETLVRKTGYEYGNDIKRTVVTKSTMVRDIKEEQHVHKYAWFRAGSVPDVQGGLTGATAGDSETILMKVGEAQKTLAAWAEGIFGKTEGGKTVQHAVARTAAAAGTPDYDQAEQTDDARRYKELLEKEERNGDEEQELEKLSRSHTAVRDGALGLHTGYAPVFRDNPDLDGRKEDAVESAGRGEMGAIMLDFQWNSMRARKGFAELSVPMYDKKMWDGGVGGFEPPTFRDVMGVVCDIAGNATGQQWLQYMDDALFATLDLESGTKTPEQIGTELAKNCAVQAAGSALGAAGKAAGDSAGKITNTALRTVTQAGISAAQSYTTSVASGYIGAVHLDGSGRLAMDWDSASESWYSAKTMAGAAGSGVTAGMNSGISSKLHAMGAQGSAVSKFYGGAINLGVSAAGKAAEYGTYLAYAGGDLGRAYDDMGGLTLNVANLGSILDMAGSIDARTNATGQSRLEKIAQSLGGAGFLEVTVGSDGLSGRIGTGGIDLGGNLYQLGKRLNDKAALEAYAASHGNREAATAYNAYVYGDWTQENTAARLAGGIDQLEFVEEGDFTAKTASSGNGRLIRMKDTGNDLNNAVQLGHEAYRDGVADSGNAAETVSAVIAHTAMASNMESWGADVSLKGLLGLEATAYKNGNTQLLEAIAENGYDSSADYWKMQVNADGSHRIIYDGKKELSIDYLDEDGKVISTMTPEDQNMSGVGMAGALAKILGSDRAEEILGSSYLNADNYDRQTLKDVLNLDDNQIARIQRKGSLEGIELTDSQKNSLLGEALLKKNGSVWNDETGWTSMGNIALTITDGLVNGNIMAELGQNGEYLYSTVNATVFRDPESWNCVISADGKTWNRNYSSYGLDSILYEKQGINYEGYESLLVDNYQTVDNLPAANRNQPFYNFESSSWIQGNTVVSDKFNMGYYTDWQGDAGFENKALVINNAKTLSGIVIGNYGGENNTWTNRWLEHDDSKFENNAWISREYQYSDGCFVTTRKNQKELLAQLREWKLSNRYQISTTLLDGAYDRTPYVGR